MTTVVKGATTSAIPKALMTRKGGRCKYHSPSDKYSPAAEPVAGSPADKD
jgi:hypothetical protein